MSLPPQALSAPPGWLRAVLTPIWIALFAFALVAQIGGTWRTVANYFFYNPPFHQLGLESLGGWNVAGSPHVEQAREIPEGSVLFAIDGVEVSETITYEELALRLDGPEGSVVTLGIALPPDGEIGEAVLERSAANREAMDPAWIAIMERIVLPILAMLAAGFCLFVSWRLWRRRDDPVAQLLAFGLIALVLTGIETFRFLSWTFPNYPVTTTMFGGTAYLIASALLVVAIPAFPDGRYRPAWSGWLAILAPITMVLLLTGTFYLVISLAKAVAEIEPGLIDHLVALPWFGLLLLVAVFAAWRRFRTTPAGKERQQVKWAALGLVFGLLTMVVADYGPQLVVQLGADLEGPAASIISFALATVRALGLIAIPLGLLMSLMGWRLNDADSVIGRSAGYAFVTLLIGALWAAMTSWLNRLIGEQLSPAATAGISTMVAAAIFVPLRERVLKWTERKFQPALVRMRALPGKLLPWRSDHNPSDVAQGALNAIADGLQARGAALVLDEEGGRRVLATLGTEPADVLDDLARDDPDKRLFPVRLELSDILGPIGTLLIGPRSDGASYNSDERAAIKLVAGPLAEVLRATSRRADRNAALAEMLTAVDERVARLERARAV